MVLYASDVTPRRGVDTLKKRGGQSFNTCVKAFHLEVPLESVVTHVSRRLHVDTLRKGLLRSQLSAAGLADEGVPRRSSVYELGVCVGVIHTQFGAEWNVWVNESPGISQSMCSWSLFASDIAIACVSPTFTVSHHLDSHSGRRSSERCRFNSACCRLMLWDMYATSTVVRLQPGGFHPCSVSTTQATGSCLAGHRPQKARLLPPLGKSDGLKTRRPCLPHTGGSA